MAFLVLLKPKAQKELDALPQRNKDKATVMLAVLARDPYAGKKLHGKHKDYFSVRIWPYRMIYRISKEKSLIIITRIGHHQGIY